MEIKSLQNLTKDGQVYNLHAQVIVDNYSYGIYVFPLTDRHTMRIDLACFDIYHNTDQVDILCALNGIFNPLTIQDGDVLFFIEDKDITNVRNNENVLKALKDSVSNANTGKEPKQDQNRLTDSANRAQTEKNKKAPTISPPNIVQTPNGNIDFSEGAIILKPNF